MPDDPTTTLTTRRFFDGEDLHGPHRIVLRDGIIDSIEPHVGSCEHELVSPGFFDLQVNGWDDINCADLDAASMARLDSMLLSLGTTGWLATLVTAPKERMRERAENIGAVMNSAPGCVGCHLEGPFLGTRHGAHDTTRVVPPDTEWVATLPGSRGGSPGSPVVRLMTVGAEHRDSTALIAALVERGVTVSLGHTSPDNDEWHAAVEAGAGMVTHLFNAMSGVHHRDFGVALRALVDERVKLGLIADMVHVQPDAVRLAFAAAPRRVCLVSDSVAWNHDRTTARGTTVRDGAPRLPDGTLAGSSTALADCVRNAVTSCGVDLVDALRAATTTPARAVGAEREVLPGHSVNLVTLDSDLRVSTVRRGLQSVRGISSRP